MNSKEQINLFWPVLKELYNQKELIDRLQILDVKISEAHISNLRTQVIASENPEKAKTSLSPKRLKILADAFLEIIKLETYQTLDLAEKKLVPISEANNGQAHSIGENSKLLWSKILLREDGRLEIAEKVKFLKLAKNEIIEIGLRLSTFTRYFRNRKDHEFKKPVIEQLNRGVNMKCLMMDPHSDLARLYFTNRAEIIKTESDSIKEMEQILIVLKEVAEELNAASTAGKMSIYTYDCLPSNHFLIVDGELDQGKMVLSPYLYGISRANSPVFELQKRISPLAFEKYWQSAQYIMEKAKEV